MCSPRCCPAGRAEGSGGVFLPPAAAAHCTLWRVGGRPLRASGTAPILPCGARGAVACPALDAIEQHAVPHRSSGPAVSATVSAAGVRRLRVARQLLRANSEGAAVQGQGALGVIAAARCSARRAWGML